MAVEMFWGDPTISTRQRRWCEEWGVYADVIDYELALVVRWRVVDDGGPEDDICGSAPTDAQAKHDAEAAMAEMIRRVQKRLARERPEANRV